MNTDMAQRIAALLDGRLTRTETLALLREVLDAPDDALAVLGHAGAVTRELEQEDRAQGNGDRPRDA
jgi:hypothetical protein